MRRREFIALLGSSAVAWPLVARAQQAERIRHIGVILGGAESDPEFQTSMTAFRQELQRLGWTDGRNAWIEIRREQSAIRLGDRAPTWRVVMASRKARAVKLSADERATLDRMCRLSDEEMANLAMSEIRAYLNVIDKIYPGAFRRALENVLIDKGLTNAELFELLDRAMRRAKTKH